MKKVYILAIFALFAANSAQAIDWNAHKDLAKKQMVEKVVDDKSASTMVEEHKDLATSQVKESISEADTTGTADKVDDTINKVNTIKGLFN